MCASGNIGAETIYTYTVRPFISTASKCVSGTRIRNQINFRKRD